MSLVFSLDIFINQINFRKIGVVTPSISATVAKNNPVVLWSSEDKVKDGDKVELNKGFQIMVTSDVFTAIDAWPFQLNLTMPSDQVALGTCTFEFKSMVASALAACGSSPYVSIQGSFKNHTRAEIATISFDARVLYYPGTEHTDMVEIIVSKPLERAPPHDQFFQPRLEGSSASAASVHDSGSNLSVETLSSSGSELLGTQTSFRRASEVNRSKLDSATKNISSQMDSPRRKSAVPESSTLRTTSSLTGYRSGDIPRVQIYASEKSSGLGGGSRSRKLSGTDRRSSIITDDFMSDE